MPGQQQRDEPPRNPGGALYEPVHDGMVRGEHSGPVTPVSVYNRAGSHPHLTSLLVLGAAGAVMALFGGTSRRGLAPRLHG